MGDWFPCLRIWFAVWRLCDVCYFDAGLDFPRPKGVIGNDIGGQKWDRPGKRIPSLRRAIPVATEVIIE